MSELKKMYRTIVEDPFPPEMTIRFGEQTLLYRKKTWRIPDPASNELVERGLRYGENPDQPAALYELVGGNLILGGCEFINPGNGLVSSITEEDMIQVGKHPGKTNLTDIDNALNILKFMTKRPTAAIMKHNNPSGVACGETLAEAYERANRADRIAAFGGCLVVNRPVDRATAELISERYLEVVAAPDYEEGVVGILARRKNLRIIRIGRIHDLERFMDLPVVEFKALIDGGIIVQQSQINRIRSRDDFLPARATYKGREYAINRMPTEREYEDMLFGWHVEQGVTSNSVIFVKDGATVGIGTGEQDRVGVAEIAVFKAYAKYADYLCHSRYGISCNQFELDVKQGRRDRAALEEIREQTRKARGGLIGSIMVSDAFFPFRDGVDVGIREGITGVVQPGGSERDFEVITACNEADVTMVFTGQRLFKH